MKKLSSAAQGKAVAFLKNEGRSLEQKLYAYHFENGPTGSVLTALEAFQNPDGGFGQALEPDIRLLDSSVYATTVAFQRLREIEAPGDHPVVVNGSRFLVDCYDAANLNWPIIPPNTDDAPHAPWWVYGGDLSHSLSNPRAEILGYLYDYPDQSPAEMRQELAESVIAHLMAQGNDMEMHDLLCYVRLFETPSLPEAVKDRLLPRLKEIVEHVVARDPAQWRAYGLPPLSVITKPDSQFAPLFRNELEANLDFAIDQQNEAGWWGPNWSWAEVHPDAWKQAERDWRSVFTLNTLAMLRAFGRLA
jgi:hypothetical protein